MRFRATLLLRTTLCVSAVIDLLAVWWHNKPTTKKIRATSPECVTKSCLYVGSRALLCRFYCRQIVDRHHWGPTTSYSLWFQLLPGFSLLFVNYDHWSLVGNLVRVVLVLDTCGGRCEGVNGRRCCYSCCQNMDQVHNNPHLVFGWSWTAWWFPPDTWKSRIVLARTSQLLWHKRYVDVSLASAAGASFFAFLSHIVCS